MAVGEAVRAELAGEYEVVSRPCARWADLEGRRRRAISVRLSCLIMGGVEGQEADAARERRPGLGLDREHHQPVRLRFAVLTLGG